MAELDEIDRVVVVLVRVGAYLVEGPEEFARLLRAELHTKHLVRGRVRVEARVRVRARTSVGVRVRVRARTRASTCSAPLNSCMSISPSLVVSNS
eukprot:scaffold22403_cov63-Phaeocystis_antarctica.AAC.1